jgi:hypothetical protein
MKDFIRVSLPLPLFTWLAQVSPILSSLYNSFCLINLPFKRVGEGGSQRRDSEKGKGVGRISSGALRANLGYLSQGRRYPYNKKVGNISISLDCLPIGQKPCSSLAIVCHK